MLLSNLWVHSLPQPATAGKSEGERQQLDGGMDWTEQSFNTETVLSGLLLQDTGSGENILSLDYYSNCKADWVKK